MCMLCSIDPNTVNMIGPIAQATIISAPILLRGHIRRGASYLRTRHSVEAIDADQAAQLDDQPASTGADPSDTATD